MDFSDVLTVILALILLLGLGGLLGFSWLVEKASAPLRQSLAAKPDPENGSQGEG